MRTILRGDLHQPSGSEPPATGAAGDPTNVHIPPWESSSQCFPPREADAPHGSRFQCTHFLHAPPPQPPARLFGSYTQTQSEKLSSALGKRNKGRSIPLPASEGKVQSQHLACAPHHQHFMKKRHEAVSHATCSEVRREVGEWFPGAPLRTGGRVIHGGKGSEYQSQCDPYPEILHLRSRLCSPTVG